MCPYHKKNSAGAPSTVPAVEDGVEVPRGKSAETSLRRAALERWRVAFVTGLV